MPYQPYWIRRLPEITETLKSLPVATIDRPTFESIFQLRRRRAIELMHMLGSRRGRRGFVLDRGALLERLESLGTVAQFHWHQQMCGVRASGQAEGHAAAVNGSNHNGEGRGRVVIEFTDENELVQKLLRILRTASDGESEDGGAGRPDACGDSQVERFERAIQAFRRQDFAAARDWFAQACAGPRGNVRTTAEQYLRICNRRLEEAFAPRSFEDHYNYGVALHNAGRWPEARLHFEAALSMNPEADFVYYAFAASLAVSGDTAGVCAHLSRAIELQPRNRLAARYDPDFELALKDPAIRELVGLSGNGE